MITMFYDDTCVLCRTEAVVLQQQHPTKIRIIPVKQGADLLAEAGISVLDAMTYLCIQDHRGKMYTHMNAVRKMYRITGKWFAPLLYLPIIKQAGDLIYPIFARNRYHFPDWFTKLVFGQVVTKPSQASDASDTNKSVTCDDGICHLPPKDRLEL